MVGAMNKKPSKHDRGTALALSRAVKFFRHPAVLAKAIGCPHSMVIEWISGRRPIPARWCKAIEEATKGHVKCEELSSRFDWKRDDSGAVVGCMLKI